MFSTLKYFKHSNLKYILPKYSIRMFGSSHSHSTSTHHDNNSHGHSGDHHDHHNNHAGDHGDHHDHHDHHHHEITGEVDLNRVHVPLSSQVTFPLMSG